MPKVGLVVAVLLSLSGVAMAKAPRRPAKSTPASKTSPAPQPAAPAKEEAAVPPKESSDPIRLAALGLTAVNVPAKVAEFYTEHLAQQMVGWGTRVVTPKEIASLVGFERQKMLVSCDESNSSCLAELGNALGVEGLVLGDLAKFGNDFQINVKVMSPADGSILASYSEKQDSEAKVLEGFNRAARSLARILAQKLNRTLPAPSADFLKGQSEKDAVPTLRERPFLSKAWIPAVAGAGAALIGGGFLLAANAAHATLTSSTQLIASDRALQLQQEGQRNQTIGWVGVGLGAAGLAAGAGMVLFTREVQDSVGVSASLAPTGNGLQLTGVFQ